MILHFHGRLGTLYHSYSFPGTLAPFKGPLYSLRSAQAVVELGGSDAYAILADCDLAQAAAAVVDARVANSGQTCIAPKRVIVEKQVKASDDDFQWGEKWVCLKMVSTPKPNG